MDRLRQYKDTERFWWRARGLELSDDTLVFPDHRTGSWREPTSVNYAVRQACKRAGVPVVSPHWLRHSGISVARLADKDIVTIAKRAGHKDISTTYGVYSHTQEAEEVALGTAFGALVGFG